MLEFFQNLSIRWKFQFLFFAVTMITTLYNRWIATNTLDQFIEIASNGGASDNVIKSLETARESFIVHGIWESGIELVIQFTIIAIVISFFVRPIRELIEALQEVESGNLMQEVNVINKDEIGELEMHFNAMTKKLRSILEGVDNGARSMGQSAFQIASISHEIADIGKKEQDNSDEVCKVTDQLVHISRTVQSTAEMVADRVRDMSRHVKDGVDMVEDNLNTMNKTIDDVKEVSRDVQVLSVTAKQISTISDTISQIAEKTNLLALNAAIEAARAGESGRGFAVVADEVRQLASNTASSAAEISTIITTLQDNVNKATSTMDSVASQVEISGSNAGEITTNITSIGEGINKVVEDSEGIVSRCGEQIQSLASQQKTLTSLFDTLGKNAAKVEVTAGIGDSLYELTEDMDTIISQFNFRDVIQFEKQANEKRINPRLEKTMIVSIEQSEQVWEGLTEDISMDGVGIQLSQPLSEDSGNVCITIKLPSSDLETFEKQRALVVDAEIQWYRQEKETHKYGFKFLNVSESDKQHIKQIFSFFYSEPKFK